MVKKRPRLMGTGAVLKASKIKKGRKISKALKERKKRAGIKKCLWDKRANRTVKFRIVNNELILTDD